MTYVRRFIVLLCLLGLATQTSGCMAARATKGVVKGTTKGAAKVTKGTAKGVKKTTKVVTKPIR